MSELFREKILEEKNALALLQQCKGQGLTIGQTRRSLEHAIALIDIAVRDHSLEHLTISGLYQKDGARIEDKQSTCDQGRSEAPGH